MWGELWGAVPSKVKIGFGATFTSGVLDTLLEVLQMKGVVLPPTLLDVAIYTLMILLGVGLSMMVWGIIEWARKTRQQEHVIEELKTTGRLEDVSQQDALWIVARGIEMQVSHGYNDIMGLFADRAHSIPLNELMTRPCSQCGIPRNQRGNHYE
jgi:hypothetical protein